MAQPENNCALHQCDNGSANLSCPQVFDARFNSGFVAVPPTTTVTAATSPLPETTEFFRSDRNISDLAAWWQQQPQQNDSSGGPTADNSGSGVASGDPQQIGLTTFVLSVSLLGALLLVSLALNAAQLHFYRQLNRRQKVYQTASVDRLQGKFTTAF